MTFQPAVLVLGLLAASCVAQAQGNSYPSKPIRLVVGYTAGGGSDIIARAVAAKLTTQIGQQVIVENKPGAASMLALEYVAHAAPDGYTLLLGQGGSLTVNPAIFKQVRYDSVKDFSPVSLVASLPLLLAVNVNGPAKDLAGLVAYAKKNPDKANYSSAAAPFRMAAEQLNIQADTKLREIPYKGSTDAVNALVAGDVLATISDPLSINIGIGTGKVKAVAISSRKPHPKYPGVPTFTEAGYRGMEIELWQGILAPAGTDKAIVEKLEMEIRKAIDSPEVKAQYAKLGLDPRTSTPQEFAQLIKDDLTRWAEVAAAANMPKQ